VNKAITLVGIALTSCGGLSGTKEAAEDQACSISARFTFPDGSVATYSECDDVLIDATFEFDPDTPPEIRSFNMQFTGTDEADFECWIKVTAYGICGSGRYRVGQESSTRVEFATYDCAGVNDAYEGEFIANTGTHTVYRAHAGDEPGNFEDEPLYTVLRGDIHAETTSGIQVDIETYTIAAYIRGTDAEEVTCLNQD